MKNKIMLLISAVIITITAQCVSFSSNDYSSGELQKDERIVDKFNSISLSLSADVIVIQGSPQKLVLEGGENDIEKIITEVNGTNLKIKSKPGSWNIGKVTIYITVEDINSFATSGSGSIKTEGKINCGNLSLAVSGSGSIEISDLKANRLESAVSGSGKIYLSGSNDSVLESQKIAISGSGNVLSENLQAGSVDVAISGSGNCRVHATENLNAGVSGSGKVYYKGNPKVNSKVSGSGKIQSI